MGFCSNGHYECTCQIWSPHRTVIFAIAQLSCLYSVTWLHGRCVNNLFCRLLWSRAGDWKFDALSIASPRHQRPVTAGPASGTSGRHSVTPLPCRRRRPVHAYHTATTRSQSADCRLTVRLFAGGACVPPQVVGEELHQRLRRRGTRGWIAVAAMTTRTMTYWIIHYPRDSTTDRENVGGICVCSTSVQAAPQTRARTHYIRSFSSRPTSSSIHSCYSCRAPPPLAYQYCWPCEPWHLGRSSRVDRLFPQTTAWHQPHNLRQARYVICCWLTLEYRVSWKSSHALCILHFFEPLQLLH